MHCATCQDTYSLPNGPNIHYRLYNDTIRCPLDHFELVLVTLGVPLAVPALLYAIAIERTIRVLYNNKCTRVIPSNMIRNNAQWIIVYCTVRAAGYRSYPLCPYCFNNPPFDEMPARGASCVECLHPTCKHSLAVNGISRCPASARCPGGMLLLDLTFSSSKFRLACNRFAHLLMRFTDAVFETSFLFQLNY